MLETELALSEADKHNFPASFRNMQAGMLKLCMVERYAEFMEVDLFSAPLLACG